MDQLNNYNNQELLPGIVASIQVLILDEDRPYCANGENIRLANHLIKASGFSLTEFMLALDENGYEIQETAKFITNYFIEK